MKLKRFLLVAIVPLFMAMEAVAAPIGINLAAPRDLLYPDAIVDIFKLSEGWYTSCQFDWQTQTPIDPGCTRQSSFNTKEQNKLSYDENGWVKSFPQSRVFSYITKSLKFPANYKRGRFVLDYQGQGDLEIIGGINIVSQAPGRIVFDLVNTRNSFQVRIYSLTRNYIRNIRLYRAENSGIIGRNHFTQNYVNKISQFQIVRYMTWSSIRTNNTVNWSDVDTPNISSYIGDIRGGGTPETGRKGIPETMMIDLSNQTRTSPWFSIPFEASDDYMRRFAHYTKQNLHKGATIYLEYSNEMWNGIFPGTIWAKWQGHRAFPGAQASFQRRGITNQYVKDVHYSINYYSQRTAQMCRIWKQVFGNQAHRVKCVLASYVGSEDFTRETLDCPLSREITGKTCASQVDYFAVGPYFGHYVATINHRKQLKQWAQNPQVGLNNLFNELLHGGVVKKKNTQGQFVDANGNVTNNPSQYQNLAPGGLVQTTINEMRKAQAITKSFGLKMISYEGGQSIIRFDGPHKLKDQRVIDFITMANKDPRMETAYRKYLQGWNSITGGQPFLHFSGLINAGSLPFFGIFDQTTDATSPKWKAMEWYKRL